MSERLGKYELLEKVAEGGMATVYRAKTVEVGGVEKIVAVKRVREELSNDQEFIQMLVDEARISVRMTNKNICQVYGIENVDNIYFIVMELIDGGDLSGLLKWFQQTNRVLPIETATFIAIEICSGLSYAHRMTSIDGVPLGLIHRDVTPQNVLISKEGEVKLIDFGIAKADVSSQHTQAGVIKGKFNYMSPEQARGEHIDQRTDVFALGAILYEMVTGQMLYPLSLDDNQLQRNIKMANYVPASKVRNDIPEELDKIIEKALARDMQQRFASSRDFLLALTSFFHNYGKQFDSLSMQMLMERYLEAKAEAKRQSDSGQKPDIQGDKLIPDSLLEEDEEAFADDGPTSVYNKNDILGLMNGMPGMSEQAVRKDLTEVNRVVDLDVHREQYSGKTEIVSIKKVKDDADSESSSKISQRMKFFIFVGVFILVICGLIILIVNLRTEEHVADFRVLIDSEPQGAEIWLDGEFSGLNTPNDVSAGHRIFIRKKFYKDFQVSLKKGEAYIKVPLEASTGKVSIATDPEGAQVFVGRKVKCKETPCEFSVKKTDNYDLIIRKSGYQDEEKRFTWGEENEDKDKLSLSFQLSPKTGME